MAYDDDPRLYFALDATLRYLQRERGICSEPECDQPIAGWCDTCDALGPFKAPKWCEAHLSAHCRPAGHVPCLLYDRPWRPGGAS
ncbi:MAG TPA: hypothetical protein VF120_14315 [Ktedonobacterales bacterium]